MSTVIYIIVAVLIFSVLILVHEGGHFMAARACGVTVLEFSMGMGPLIFQKTSKKGTKISLRALPIGGFCAMEGEDEASEDPHAFRNASAWKQVIILVAGSAMNFLLGLLLIACCFISMDRYTTPVITEFYEGCPYEGEEALQLGDTFYSVNGHRIYFTYNVSEFLSRSGSDYADIVVIRDGEKVELNDFYMVLQEYVDEETGETDMKYGLYFGVQETGLGAKIRYTWYCAEDFVRSVWLGLEDLFTGSASMKDMSGVVGIVDVIATTGKEAATTKDAILDIVYLSAFIAINLSVMNMLPIPALDGGRVFFLIITVILEAVLRKKIDPKYEAYINAAALMLLMLLMVLVMYNDVVRIVTR